MAIGDKKSAVMQSDIVNDFTTGGAENVLSAEMGKILSERPNPNLIDNWYFIDPIDQRGGYIVPTGIEYYTGYDTGSPIVAGTTTGYHAVRTNDDSWATISINNTTYGVPMTSVVRGYMGAGYGIDRWRGGNSAAKCSITEDGLRIFTNTDAYSQWYYYFENPEQLFGKTVTLSALRDDGTLFYDTAVIPDNFLTASKEIARASIGALVLGTERMSIKFSTNGDVTLKAIKLELGSVQTLAHQDADGNWVLNEIPDKGEQLAKCQRYFYTFDFTGWPGVSAYWGRGISNTEIELYNMTFPVTMRINPAANTLKIYDADSGATYDVVSNGHYHKKEGLRAIGVSSGMTVTVNQLYLVTKAQFSADL